MEYLTYLTPIIILFVTYLCARSVNKLLNRSFSRLKSKDVDTTFYSFNRRIIIAAIYLTGFVFVVYSIPPLRGWAYSMMASVGLLALIIGFAAKDIFSNIIAGVFIAIFKPFRVGDVLSYSQLKGVDGITGEVEDINLRHTVIKTWDNNRIIVPNSNLTSSDLINHSLVDKRVKRLIEFSISYDSDITTAKEIIRKIILEHQDCLNPSIFKARKIVTESIGGMPDNEEITIKVTELGDYGVKIGAWVWAESPAKAYCMKCDILEAVKLRFDEAGIEIPYPYRTLVLKKTFKKK